MKIRTTLPLRRAAVIGFVSALVTVSTAAQVPVLTSVSSIADEAVPARELTPEEEARWKAGRELFTRVWDATTGLGAPGFNAASCATCHVDPVLGGAGGPEFDVLSIAGMENYGAHGLAGDRQAAMRRLAEAVGERPRQGKVLAIEVRQTPSLLGLGRIDTIPDDEILAREDPEDRDGDGISGVASRVRIAGRAGSRRSGAIEIGRFGWKAEVPRLDDFVCRALGGETGITAPDQERGFGLFEDADRVRDPELSQEGLDDLSFYVAHLAPPRRRSAEEVRVPEVRAGGILFERIGCAACHVPELQGTEGPVALYSDLLLHDVLPEDEGSATPIHKRRANQKNEDGVSRPLNGDPRRFRTTPLWGVGKTAPYLHDGRAATLDEAIRAHAGEASLVVSSYLSLTADNRAALLAFLEDL